MPSREFRGSFLVPAKDAQSFQKLPYQVVRRVEDYKEGNRVIIVPTLKAEYFVLFSSIKLIVTAKGSELAHLAILGREHGMPIFLVDNITVEVPESGMLSLEGEELRIEV